MAYNVNVKYNVDSRELKNAHKDAKNTNTSIKSSIASVRKWAVAAAGVTAAAGATFLAYKKIENVVVDIHEEFLQVARWADYIGASALEMSKLKVIAESNGAAFADVTDAMQRQQREIEKNADIYEKIGLNIEELKRLRPEETFEAVVKAIKDIDDTALRSKALRDLLGRSGTQLLEMVDSLKDIQDLTVTEKFLLISDDDVSRAKTLNDLTTNIQN